jgi:hypothetical protein
MDYNKLKAEILAELHQEFYLVPRDPKPSNTPPIRFSVKWSNGKDISELHVYGSEPPIFIEPKPVQVHKPEPKSEPESAHDSDSEFEYDSQCEEYDSESEDEIKPVDPKPITKFKYTHSSNYTALVNNPEMLEIFEQWYIPNEKKYNALKHAFNSLIKHESFIEISSDGNICTNKGPKRKVIDFKK